MKDPLEEAGVEVNSRVAHRHPAGCSSPPWWRWRSSCPAAARRCCSSLGIILMVMLHEFGHYWTAKRSGMKVTEFFVGFGPRLWSFTRGETEYGVKAIPAGGYVRIIGMTNLEEVDPADEPRTFRQGTPGKRLTVILAGVTVNLIIAFVLFFVVIAGQGRVSDGPNTTVNQVVGRQRRPRGRAADRRQDRRRQRHRDLRLGPAQVDDREATAAGRSTSPSMRARRAGRGSPPPRKRQGGQGFLGRRARRHDPRRRRRWRRCPRRSSRWGRSSPASPTSSATGSRRRA